MNISHMAFSGEHALLGTQLAEVFSIHINPKTFDDRVIFGTIYVEDDIGNDILVLYDQGSTSPDFISARGSSLPLISPHRPISAAKRFTLYVDLRDANGNSEFIKGSYSWDADTPTSYDTCLSIPFNGKQVSATIYFTILSVAVNATISIKLDKEMSGFGFYGSVVAHYEKNFIDHLPNQDVKEACQISLFNKTCDEAALPENGVQIPISRSLLAVPVFSSLVVHVNLRQLDFSGQLQQIVTGDVAFQAIHSGLRKKVIQKNDISFSVVVEWELPEISPFLKKSTTEKGFSCPSEILEVTSVRIVMNPSDDNRYAEVYGDLCAGDSRNCIYLFSGTKDVSVPLLSDDIIPLEFPWRCLDGSNYALKLSLMEKCRDLEICNGYFSLTPGVYWIWPNCRMAAVIPGKDGYAVVHFTAFSSAVQAIVEVTLCGADGETAISGDLIARVGNYDYASDYARKYFQMRLLTAPEDQPIRLHPECEGEDSKAVVLLRKCAVAVPRACPLIIEANLTHSKGFVRGSVTFSPQPSGEHFAHIGDEDGGIDVKVTWVLNPFDSQGVALLGSLFTTTTTTTTTTTIKSTSRQKLNEPRL